MQPETKPVAQSLGSAHLYEDDTADSRYLVFGLGPELYGTPLIGVKEVIKYASVNPVPYMANHFKGVINLRGQIIGVVDLRQRFGIPVDDPSQGLILVTENDGRVMGVVVDDVVSVSIINSSQIEQNPSLVTKIPVDFFLGIGKFNDRLVNLISLGACLNREDYAAIQKSQEALLKRES